MFKVLNLSFKKMRKKENSRKIICKKEFLIFLQFIQPDLQFMAFFMIFIFAFFGNDEYQARIYVTHLKKDARRKKGTGKGETQGGRTVISERFNFRFNKNLNKQLTFKKESLKFLLGGKHILQIPFLNHPHFSCSQQKINKINKIQQISS